MVRHGVVNLKCEEIRKFRRWDDELDCMTLTLEPLHAAGPPADITANL